MSEWSNIDADQLDEWVEISPDGGHALLTMIARSVAAARRDIPQLFEAQAHESQATLHRLRGEFFNKGGREIGALLTAAEMQLANVRRLDPEGVEALASELLQALDDYERSVKEWCASRGLSAAR